MKVPSLTAVYVDTLLQGTEPGTVILRTTALLAEARTEDAWGLITTERVIASPPWPGASDDEGADDET